MERQQNKNTEFKQVYNEHVQTLQECMSVCIACAKKCLEEGHKKSALSCTECADICYLTIKAVCGQSQFESKIIELCASVCKKCGETCQSMEAKHCQECADVCKHCAESCSGSYSLR